jgi:hypothetical protein
MGRGGGAALHTRFVPRAKKLARARIRSCGTHPMGAKAEADAAQAARRARLLRIPIVLKGGVPLR